MDGTSQESYQHPDTDDITHYQVAVPTDDWETWKRTIPRTVPLYRRIHELLKLDARRDADDTDDANLRLISLKFQRVQQRVENTRVALDDGDTDRAREELDAIEEIATGLVE